MPSSAQGPHARHAGQAARPVDTPDASGARWRRLFSAPIAPTLCAGLLVLLSAFAAVAGDEEETPARVALFDFELIDTSLEGEIRGSDELETARLAMLGDQLRQAFSAAPGYSLADIGPVRQAANARNLHACPGCGRKLAAQVGADLVVTGTVQKVSNLILNINIYIQDVATGDRIQVASADIRGNTDESWRRGLQWLIRNRLKLDAQPQP